MAAGADKQAVVRALQKYNNGAGVITVAEFARFLGFTSHAKVKRKLATLPAFEGKYYLVTDVADLWLRGIQEGGIT